MGPAHEQALARFHASAARLAIVDRPQALRFAGRAPREAA
jgi:hypothetical protein